MRGHGNGDRAAGWDTDSVPAASDCGSRSSSLEIWLLSSAVRSIYLTRNCCNQCGVAFNCLPGEREEYYLVGRGADQLQDSDKAMSKCQRFQPKTFHWRQEDDFGLMRKSPTTCRQLVDVSPASPDLLFSMETERKCLKSISWALIAPIPCGIVRHLLSTCSRSLPSLFAPP